MNVEMDFDIRGAADQVNELLGAGRGAEATALLASHSENQPQVIKETLDRYVAAGVLAYLKSPDGAQAQDRSGTLDRLALVDLAPRFPGADEMMRLSSDNQRYDVYASIIMTKGSVSANDALARHQRVILGLRNETSTIASGNPAAPGSIALDNPRTRHEDESRKGTGVYDDRLVVLWRSADGRGNLVVSELANTEPSAQYDAHARPIPTRSGTAFADVKWRRAEGQDVDGDGTADLGRLATGTFEMQAARHANASNEGGTHFALRPSAEAVRNGWGVVERDTNADGWFTEADINGRQDLNSTFKIHKGSRRNSDSAGCQTIHRDDYQDFENAVTANPHQTRWQYVLTSTTPSEGRELQLGGARVRDNVRAGVHAGPVVAPQMPPAQSHGPQHPGLPPGEGHRGGPGLRHELRDQDHGPAPGSYRPDDPRHPDHRLLLQIRGIVRTLEGAGASDGAADERLSRALLPVARGSGMTSIDHLMAHGGKLFLVQGRLHDPANLHASIDTQVAMRTGLEQADRQLEEIHRRLGAERGQQQVAHQSQVQSNEALSLRV